MDMNTHHEAAVHFLHVEKARRTATQTRNDVTADLPVTMEFGSGWYHEAAIEEAQHSHLVPGNTLNYASPRTVDRRHLRVVV